MEGTTEKKKKVDFCTLSWHPVLVRVVGTFWEVWAAPTSALAFLLLLSQRFALWVCKLKIVGSSSTRDILKIMICRSLKGTEMGTGLCSLPVAWLVVGTVIEEGGKNLWKFWGKSLAEISHPTFSHKVCMLGWWNSFLLTFVTEVVIIPGVSLFVRNKELVKHSRYNRDQCLVFTLLLFLCVLCLPVCQGVCLQIN